MRLSAQGWIHTGRTSICADRYAAIRTVPRLPVKSKAGHNRRVNATVSMWQKGFVKSRLAQKYRERSVELVEVFGKGISIQCSCCGADGKMDEGIFRCPSYGMELPERQNTAVNVRKRGHEQREENGSL